MKVKQLVYRTQESGKRLGRVLTINGN